MDNVSIVDEREAIALARQLSEAIKRSDEYISYMDMLAKIKEQPDLYNQVNQLRREHFRLQNTNAVTTMSYEVYSGIAAESARLRENPLVSKFLNAEIGLGRLIQSVNKEIMADIYFDDEFLTY